MKQETFTDKAILRQLKIRMINLRIIKPFVMGWKNWLFANTPGGAQDSSAIYSLIETAKENHLDPYRYLLWILWDAPALSQTDAAWAEQFAPAGAPDECRITLK